MYQPSLIGGNVSGCWWTLPLCLSYFTPAILHTPHGGLWQWVMPSFALASTWGLTWKRCLWDIIILGSIRVGMEGRRKPTVYFAPGYKQPCLCPLWKEPMENAYFRWPWKSEFDFVISWRAGREAEFELDAGIPLAQKTSPFLPSSKFLSEILSFDPTGNYKPS